MTNQEQIGKLFDSFCAEFAKNYKLFEIIPNPSFILMRKEQLTDKTYSEELLKNIEEEKKLYPFPPVDMLVFDIKDILSLN